MEGEGLAQGRKRGEGGGGESRRGVESKREKMVHQKVLLGCMLAAMATVKAQDMGAPVQCTVAYTAAYMSTLNGECSVNQCTPNCQAKINAVRTSCSNQK